MKKILVLNYEFPPLGEKFSNNINIYCLVPKADSSALREAITHHLENTELLKQHGKKSRELAEKMSWEKVAKQYRDTYRICLRP